MRTSDDWEIPDRAARVRNDEGVAIRARFNCGRFRIALRASGMTGELALEQLGPAAFTNGVAVQSLFPA